MKVIEFSDSFLPIMDGVGNVVYQYAKNIAEKGHECYVVAPQTDTGYRGNWPFELVDYVGVPLLHMKSYRVGVPLLDSHCVNRLSMIEADIAHVHSPFVAGQTGLLYAQKHNVPLVGTFHSKYYDDFLQLTGIELLAEVGVKVVVDFYEKCSEVWAVSESSANTLRSYGYHGDIRIMPNGTDIQSLPEKEIVTVSERFELQDSAVLLYVGQMNWKKNIRCILEAASLLKREFRLVLAGQGPHEGEIRKLAEELGVGEKMVYTGHLTDHDLLNGLYARADLFLFPSLYDTSGLVVREAAAMGTPSIVVEGSSAAECIQSGENGFVCKNDPADLARVIEEALSQPDSLQRIGTAAKKTIPIPWSLLTDEVIDRYTDIIQRRSVT